MAENVLATILLATDGSPDAHLAARAAADLAGRFGAALHIAHIWHLPPIIADDVASAPGASMREAAYICEACEEEARTLLDAEVRDVEATGTPVAGAHLLLGRAGTEIVALAAELHADLVVLGSRGLGPVRRLVLGSVSEEVTQHAPCPVLVLRGGEGAWPPARVVIGVDGSPDADRAAELGAAIGGRFGATGTLVRACPELQHLRRLDPELAAEWREEALAQAETSLVWRADNLAAAFGQRPSLRIAIADPAHLLLEITDDPGGPALLVVGSRGLGAWQRLRLGSTSTRVLHAAPGPVLVCPHRAADEHGQGVIESGPAPLRH